MAWCHNYVYVHQYLQLLQVEFHIRGTNLDSTVKISDKVSMNGASLGIAGGLCFVSSDVPLVCGASSSVDARFRFGGC